MSTSTSVPKQKRCRENYTKGQNTSNCIIVPSSWSVHLTQSIRAHLHCVSAAVHVDFLEPVQKSGIALVEGWI